MLPSILGLMAGAAGSLLVPHLNAKGSVSSRPVAAPIAAARPARIDEPLIAERLPAPVAEESFAAPTPAASSAVARGPTDLPTTIEETRRFHENRHRKALEDHRHEPRDPAWADAAESKFFGDLRAVAEEGRFTIQGVSCKTTTCVATAKWNSFDSAEQHYESILHAGYQVNCTKEVLLPEPELPQAQYQASVIFDCQKARAEGEN